MTTVGRMVATLGVVALLATACGSDGAGTAAGSTTLAPGETTPADAAAGGAPTAAAPGGPTPAADPAGGPAAGPGATSGAATGGGPGPSAGGLAGIWAGEYTSIVPANDSGTFTVVFDSSPPDYTGSLVTPGLCEPDCPITAKVAGSTITFGSVGPRAVTYTGTISGNSMSGSYTVGSEGQGKGTWSAVRR